MAFVTDIRTGGSSFSSRFAALRSDVKHRYGQYQTYRTTLAELNSLTKRELNDIGIGTGDIRRIALEAAYG